LQVSDRSSDREGGRECRTMFREETDTWTDGNSKKQTTSRWSREEAEMDATRSGGGRGSSLPNLGWNREATVGDATKFNWGNGGASGAQSQSTSNWRFSSSSPESILRTTSGVPLLASALGATATSGGCGATGENEMRGVSSGLASTFASATSPSTDSRTGFGLNRSLSRKDADDLLKEAENEVNNSAVGERRLPKGPIPLGSSACAESNTFGSSACAESNTFGLQRGLSRKEADDMLKDAEDRVNSRPIGVDTSLTERPFSLQSGSRSFNAGRLGGTDPLSSSAGVTNAISKLRSMTAQLRHPAVA